MLVRACCCEPPTVCDYSDDFAYLRDYELSLRQQDSAAASEFPTTIARGPAADTGGPIDLQQAELDGDYLDQVGGGGWYTSDLRPQLTGVNCIEGCDDEPNPPIEIDPGVRVWTIGVTSASGQRLFCRKTPILDWPIETPLDQCLPEGEPSPTAGTSITDSGWSYADIGHLLRRFTAASVGSPVVSIAATHWNDPTYATSWAYGLRNSSSTGCEPVNSGGYYEWGLHVGEAVYGAATTSPGDTGTYNVVRVCLDRSAESLGSTSATKYLRIWDAAGEYTEVNLGTASTVSTSSGVPLSLTLTRTGSDTWTIDADGHAETGVNLDFGDDITAVELPMGVYCLGAAFTNDAGNHHGGGEWSALCVNGVDTSDGCSLCASDGLGDSWQIETTIGSGFYSAALGDCDDPVACLASDPWGGSQVLAPYDDGVNTCSWRSCSFAPVCFTNTEGTFCKASTTRAITITTDTVNDKLVLEYWYVTTVDPTAQTVSVHLLAAYEADLSAVCGPATFSKVTDNTSGSDFPATVTATRIYKPEACDSEGEPTDAACCRPLPESPTATVTVDPFSGGADTSTTVTAYANGYLVEIEFTNIVNCPGESMTRNVYIECVSVNGVGGWEGVWLAFIFDGADPPNLSTIEWLDGTSGTASCDPLEIVYGFGDSDPCANALIWEIEITE